MLKIKDKVGYSRGPQVEFMVCLHSAIDTCIKQLLKVAYIDILSHDNEPFNHNYNTPYHCNDSFYHNQDIHSLAARLEDLTAFSP